MLRDCAPRDTCGHYERNIASNKGCNTPPYSAGRLHLTTTPEAFAFSVSGRGTDFDTEKPWRSSVIRSYTYLQQNSADTMVLVSIERRDGTTPPTSELEELTHAQVTEPKKAAATTI